MVNWASLKWQYLNPSIKLDCLDWFFFHWKDFAKQYLLARNPLRRVSSPVPFPLFLQSKGQQITVRIKIWNCYEYMSEESSLKNVRLDKPLLRVPWHLFTDTRGKSALSGRGTWRKTAVWEALSFCFLRLSEVNVQSMEHFPCFSFFRMTACINAAFTVAV